MEKKYDNSNLEPFIQEFWQNQQVYKFIPDLRPIFSVDTPPPTVSGSLHIGHVFSYIQADILVRYKRMTGHNVFYPFGSDGNGLPTEKYVEKKNKISAHNMKRSDFINICIEETKKAQNDFQKLWQRLGLSIDWSITYSTIDNQERAVSQKSFIELYNKKYIYRKFDPSIYCTNCRTTVAQAELDDEEKPSKFSDIIFKVDGIDFTVGTTRPEMLSSCVAVFYNPQDTRYHNLKNKKALVPLFNFEVPILEDDKVIIEKGTGLVMCCTFGDSTDVYWFKKHNLEYKQSIGFDGKILESINFINSLKVHEAREKILELLKNENLIVNQKNITHTVKVHERCKKEVEYLALQQWFLKIIDYKKDLIKISDQINWYPDYMKSRYINWVENIEWDWCLSRQRFYGVPFPAWHCLDCKHILLPKIEDLPIDPQEINYFKECLNCHSKNIVADTDVMDTWNTSSVTPYILKKISNQPDNFIPMSMRPQAHDIIRTWAFYTIAKSWMHENKIPWKDIVISGHVLASNNEKISKSKGNSILDPDTLISKYPADAIRYWTASASLGQDTAFSETRLSMGQKLIIKLWNAFLFIFQNLENYNFENCDFLNFDFEILGEHNKWILSELSEKFKEYQNNLQNYEFSAALTKSEEFFWSCFCDNYIEIIKDVLTNPSQYDSSIVNSTKNTLYIVGFKILQMYAPFMSHITEIIYQSIYKKNLGTDSLHNTNYDNFKLYYNFKEESKLMSQVIDLISTVRRLKTESQISLKTSIKELTIYSTNEKLKNLEKLILGITKAEKINFIRQSGPTEIKENNSEYFLFINI